MLLATLRASLTTLRRSRSTLLSHPTTPPARGFVRCAELLEGLGGDAVAFGVGVGGDHGFHGAAGFVDLALDGVDDGEVGVGLAAVGEVADLALEGLGSFVVEATAALSILLYLAFLWLANRWNQQCSAQGIFYSVLTGICVGAGTIAFFLLFQKGGPLSTVPAILAGGAAIMAIAGILFFREAPSWQRIFGVVFAIIGLFLLRK